MANDNYSENALQKAKSSLSPTKMLPRMPIFIKT